MKSTFTLLLILCINAIQVNAQITIPPINENWTKGPTERFKGDVWVQYFMNDTASDFLSSRVLFAANARSNWHKHAGKQIIFVIEGEGYYKESGKPIQILKKGDLIVIPPNTIHSHGSIGKPFMQGVMMNEINSSVATIWLEPVSDAALH